MALTVESTNVSYSDDYIETQYEYQSTRVERKGPKLVVIVVNKDLSTFRTFIAAKLFHFPLRKIPQATPHTNSLHIRTARKVPRLGVLLVGWGGNNGSTLTAALLANKLGLSWRTRSGTQEANWYGSITQASTVRLGTGPSGEDVYVPMCSLLPMASPDDIVVDGWDISSLDLDGCMRRAQVFEPELRDQLQPYMAKLKPRPSVYDADFIAANQSDRADNTIKGTKFEQYEQICHDIDQFRHTSGVDHVLVLWTANTERFSDMVPGVNDTAANLRTALANNHAEISPSTIFAYAAITKRCTYINGSPSNTFVPGIVELAEDLGVFIAGDDFKSGQTKLKSVLVDFLISAGIKPVSIVSYNHLGNNDGKNLSAPMQFRSKEISKSNVVDDMVQSNPVLYTKGETPDHCVVIKYVPYVGDSKRAMDEYTSQLMMGGHNTLVIHNTCEDSLLAAPIILDLIILAELCSRIQFKQAGDEQYERFHPVLSVLSYLCKAPLVPRGTPVINALFKQRSCIENVLRACLGLPPDNNMLLEHKVQSLMVPAGGKHRTAPVSAEIVANGVHM